MKRPPTGARGTTDVQPCPVRVEHAVHPTPRSQAHRRPRSRVFDVLMGASAAALLMFLGFGLAGAFTVAPLYGDDPIPRSSTARNECQALVIDKVGDEDFVRFEDDQASVQMRPDRSWVIRGPLETERNGDTREGEYACDGLRELPPGSNYWRSDRVIVLGLGSFTK